MPNTEPISLFWFRRDLRLTDNHGLYEALRAGRPVLPFFLFDTCILDRLENRSDRRVTFIHQAVSRLAEEIRKQGGTMDVRHGEPETIWETLCDTYPIQAVYTNHDYEKYGCERDRRIRELLEKRGIRFLTFKDQVIFEKDEVVKDDGKPYTVFTPYSRKWKQRLAERPALSHPSETLTDRWLHSRVPGPIPTLAAMGFTAADTAFPSDRIAPALLQEYQHQRDLPGVPGTSRLGVHLRFGTLSIRQLAREAASAESFLNELIWRDFYHMILWHFPHINEAKAFKRQYDAIAWRHDEAEFERWCNGQTGYPIVDAGMRELNTTGFMHNRVRMITASFLCKHLLIDWRWGEAYFAAQLLDFDFAANNGGWQWAAGSGCDAAPYFRIFNPYLQTKKFDPKLDYIRRWVPEFESLEYPPPLVNHEFARKRCLETYGKALKP